MQDNILHPKITELENKWEEAKAHGEYISLNEKLYQMSLLHANARSQFHKLEATKKILKAKLACNFRASGQAKTIAASEDMARLTPEYAEIIDLLQEWEEYYLQAKAKMVWYSGKMQEEVSASIDNTLNRKEQIIAGSGEGK